MTSRVAKNNITVWQLLQQPSNDHFCTVLLTRLAKAKLPRDHQLRLPKITLTCKEVTEAVAESPLPGVFVTPMFRFSCRPAGLRPSFADLTPGGVSSPPLRDPHTEHGDAEYGGEDGSSGVWKYTVCVD